MSTSSPLTEPRTSPAPKFGHRLLVDFPHGNGPARLCRGARRDALISTAHQLHRCGSLMACEASGAVRWGVAQEGTVALEVVLPALASSGRPRRLGCGRRLEGGSKMSTTTGIPTGVILGMDPHKRSATIEVLAPGEQVLGGGRFGTDTAGYRDMLTAGRAWPQRTWAVEGAGGIGKHLAQRLLADGEQVIDVPATLSARVRLSVVSEALRCSRIILAGHPRDEGDPVGSPSAHAAQRARTHRRRRQGSSAP